MSIGGEEGFPIANGSENGLRPDLRPGAGLVEGKLRPVRDILSRARANFPGLSDARNASRNGASRVIDGMYTTSKGNMFYHQGGVITETLYVHCPVVLPSNQQVFVEAESVLPKSAARKMGMRDGGNWPGAERVEPISVLQRIARAKLQPGFAANNLKLRSCKVKVFPLNQVDLTDLKSNVLGATRGVPEDEWTFIYNNNNQLEEIDYIHDMPPYELVEINLEKPEVQAGTDLLEVATLPQGLYDILNGRLIRKGTNEEESTDFVELVAKVLARLPQLR